VLALVGDGAFQMTGMELLTAKRLGMNPIVIIINNSSFASLRAMGHEDADFVNISTIDYADLAKVLGGNGFVIRTGLELRRALSIAKDSENFSILDVRISADDISPALQRLKTLFTQTLK
jgi:indolepyruvate decarboxylase